MIKLYSGMNSRELAAYGRVQKLHGENIVMWPEISNDGIPYSIPEIQEQVCDYLLREYGHSKKLIHIFTSNVEIIAKLTEELGDDIFYLVVDGMAEPAHQDYQS